MKIRAAKNAYLLLGSNLGDSRKLIQEALVLLGLVDEVKVSRTSSLYKTEPWGVKNQNMFWNIAVEIKTTLSPFELLSECQQIEQNLGRNREQETRWGERTMDIDIIFYDNEVVETENLSIPHKLMHKRAFVLVPLIELVPDFVHPILKKSVIALYDELDERDGVMLST